MVFDILGPAFEPIIPFIILICFVMMALGFTSGSFSVGALSGTVTFVYLAKNLPVPFLSEIMFLIMIAILFFLAYKITGFALGGSDEAI